MQRGGGSRSVGKSAWSRRSHSRPFHSGRECATATSWRGVVAAPFSHVSPTAPCPAAWCAFLGHLLSLDPGLFDTATVDSVSCAIRLLPEPARGAARSRGAALSAARSAMRLGSTDARPTGSPGGLSLRERVAGRARHRMRLDALPEFRAVVAGAASSLGRALDVQVVDDGRGEGSAARPMARRRSARKSSTRALKTPAQHRRELGPCQ